MRDIAEYGCIKQSVYKQQDLCLDLFIDHDQAVPGVLSDGGERVGFECWVLEDSLYVCFRRQAVRDSKTSYY
jgi:hypothetical protein